MSESCSSDAMLFAIPCLASQSLWPALRLPVELSGGPHRGHH